MEDGRKKKMEDGGNMDEPSKWKMEPTNPRAFITQKMNVQFFICLPDMPPQS